MKYDGGPPISGQFTDLLAQPGDGGGIEIGAGGSTAHTARFGSTVQATPAAV